MLTRKIDDNLLKYKLVQKKKNPKDTKCDTSKIATKIDFNYVILKMLNLFLKSINFEIVRVEV